MTGNNSNIKISVIVPIYNSEKFIIKCLESILNQTLSDIEIILLNDGSTDNSHEIIMKYQKKDKRIKYYFHNNIGVGSTRNKGILMARGEYISFIDSDDYIKLDMLEKMYNEVKKKASDVVVCETYIKEKDNIRIRKQFANNKVIDIKKRGINLFLYEYFFTNIFRNCVWDKLFKREYLIEKQITFGTCDIFAEDLFFQFHLIMNKPKIAFVNEPLYYYVQRQESLMHSVNSSFMNKHLILVNKLYALNSKEQAIVSMFVNCILFQGLLNETRTFLLYKRGFKSYRKTMAKFYSDASYTTFLKSMKQNKSYKLYKIKSKRYLFYVFYMLENIHFRLIAEIILYVKQSISIKKNYNKYNIVQGDKGIFS